jgi:hypothetical protein
LPDAAERIRPAKKTAAAPRAAPARGAAWSRALVALAPKSRRGFAGAALAAMMIGIVVNAVALQHGKRLQLPPLPATAAVAPPAATPSPVAAATPAPSPNTETASAEDAAPTPPSRPAASAAHVAKSGDGIGEFLRANGPEARKLVASAQTALLKLGYVVKSTGTMDADTRSALAEFQKAHHLPVSTDVTAKLLKSLNAAVAAN